MIRFISPKVIPCFTLLFLFCCITCNSANANKQDTVALVMKSLANPFFSKMVEGAQNKAAQFGIPLETFGLERETDVQQQISIMEHLISLEYGAILLAPADSRKLVPVCKKALEKNIPVIILDNPLHQQTLDDFEVSFPFVGPDNYQGGQLIGNYVASKLGGTGRVIILKGILEAENSEQRTAGLIQALTDTGSIEIAATAYANWHTDVAISVATELLKAHQDIDAIICANDAMALGALQSVELLGLPADILITGYDNTENIRTELGNGKIHATVEQYPEIMGTCGVEKAFALLQGNPAPPSADIEVDLVSHESFGKRISFSVSTSTNAFFSILVEAAQNAAKLHGIELNILDAENLDAQQLVDINNALLQQIDLLIVNPTNSEYILSALEAATNQNIPIITVDRKASGSHVLSHIESDNAAGGELAALQLANYLAGVGNVAEIEGIPGTSAAYERGKSFNLKLADYPDISVQIREIADFDRAKARKVALRLIDNKAELDGIFAHNDDMILGVLDAYDERGLTPPKALIGFDAIPEARAEVFAGRLHATIAQQPARMGMLALKTAARHFRHEKVPPQILVELSVITADKQSHEH